MRIIEELEGLVSNQLGVIKTCISITKLETRLGALSIGPLLMNLCFLLIGVISIWFAGMSILGYSLILITKSVIIALASIFIINSLILVIIYKRLQRNLKNMSFEKTRAFLSQGRESHEVKKTDNGCPSNPGKELMDTTDAAK